MYSAYPNLLDIFQPDSSAPRPQMTLGALAKVFGVSVGRLEPLALAGYLKLKSDPPLTSSSYVESPPEAAIIWLRNWFQPMRAKPLWSLDDVAQLLKVKSKTVLELAAKHSVPVVHDPALGHTFSIMAVKALIVQDARRKQGPRFDRQALMWRLCEGDARRPQQMPRFEEEWEQELERVGKLEEPARTVRRADLMDAWLDAQGVWEAYRSASGSSMSSASLSQDSNSALTSSTTSS